MSLRTKRLIRIEPPIVAGIVVSERRPLTQMGRYGALECSSITETVSCSTCSWMAWIVRVPLVEGRICI